MCAVQVHRASVDEKFQIHAACFFRKISAIDKIVLTCSLTSSSAWFARWLPLRGLITTVIIGLGCVACVAFLWFINNTPWTLEQQLTDLLAGISIQSVSFTVGNDCHITLCKSRSRAASFYARIIAAKLFVEDILAAVDRTINCRPKDHKRRSIRDLTRYAVSSLNSRRCKRDREMDDTVARVSV